MFVMWNDGIQVPLGRCRDLPQRSPVQILPPQPILAFGHDSATEVRKVRTNSKAADFSGSPKKAGQNIGFWHQSGKARTVDAPRSIWGCEV
jgi:hypothetical protein